MISPLFGTGSIGLRAEVTDEPKVEGGRRQSSAAPHVGDGVTCSRLYAGNPEHPAVPIRCRRYDL